MILFVGILTLTIPLCLIIKWLFIIQIIIAIKLFFISGKLFSSWKNKQKEIDILVKRNKNEFRPETFETFMQAPCGRLVVHIALKELNKQSEYKKLLFLQKSLLERIKDSCTPSKTTIYINEEII